MMRGLVVGGMLAATVLAGGGAAEAQDAGAVGEYTNRVTLLSDMTADTMADLGELTSDLLEDMGNDEIVRDLLAETGVFEAVYEAARELEPPAALEPAHEEFVKGMELLAEAAPLLREGFSEQDTQAMTEANELMLESQEHIEESTRLLGELVD